jgi:HlyD family secretion protein
MDKKKITQRLLGVIFLALILVAVISFARTYLLSKGTSIAFMRVSGRIEGKEYHAATKVAGRVDKITVEEGDVVQVGCVIGEVYSQQLNAALAAARARYRQAESNFDLAQVEFKRYSRLYKGKAIAKMEYDYIKNKYKRAAEDLFIAEKDVDRATADLEDTKIIAPISGVIVTKIVRQGEVVAVGTPLVAMINMDDLYLKVFLSTELAGKVSLNNEAKVFADALTAEEFEAYVDKISEKAEFTPKNVETQSQRAKLVFEIKLRIKENKNHKLKPGMPCEGVIKINNSGSWAEYKR